MNIITNISVCIPIYNTNPKFLEECFLSVNNAIMFFKRYYNNIPINVYMLDDGTTKLDTLETIDKILKKHAYIKLYKHNKNFGLSAAINTLLTHVPEHSLVIYIDSDDMMMYNRIVVQYEIHTQRQDITLCATQSCTPNNIINRDNYILKYANYSVFSKIEDMHNNIICHPTVSYKIDHIRQHGITYDTKLKSASDFDFYINILSHGLKILCIPDALTWWRKYPDSEKPDSNRDYAGDFRKIQKKYNDYSLWG